MIQRNLGRLTTISVVVNLMFCYLLTTVYAGAVASGKNPEPPRPTHHLPIILNNGQDMLMGANLVMLAQLGMSPGLDRQVLGRGRSMMAPGKQGLQQILADPGMEEALPEDGGAPPSMDYVRQLTAAMVQVADTLDQVQLREPDPDSTAMHYFNILISQALAIALEGSSLIVTEQGNMAEPHRNTENFERGKTMLTDARTMIIQVMGSRSMTEMHSRGAGKMAAMSFTHKLMGDALKVLDLLDRLAR